MRKKKIRRIEVPQITVASGSSAAVDTALGALNGIIRQIIVTVNDNTGDKTATVALLDEDDYTLFSHAAIAEAATTAIQYWTLSSTDLPLTVLVDGEVTLKMTPSGDPSTTGMTVDVVIYIDEG